MTVAGNDIKRSEFEYFFFKNNAEGTVDKKTLDEYAGLFVNFKMKVAAAVDAGIDTTQAFLSEHKEYRGIEAKKYLLDSARVEKLAMTVFNKSREEAGPKGLYYLGMITVKPEDATPEAVAAAKVRIDSIYNLLSEGADFRRTASRYSQDEVAANGGLVGWVGVSDIPPVISDVVFSLEPDQMSEPNISEYGWQIFKIFGQRKFDDFAEHRASIMEWIDKNNLDEECKLEKAKSIAAEKGWDLSPEEALAREDSLLEEWYPEFNLLSKEYHDGLLLFEISNREIWNKAAADTAALEAWFTRYRDKFDFEKPHFKGLVVFARNERDFNGLKSLIEDKPYEEWIDNTLAYNSDTIRVRVMRGPFVKGANSICDYIVFGEGENQPMPGFPYSGYIGEIVTKPSEWTDVSGQVIGDYQDALEKEWVGQLREKYDYKINRKVLKTVGHHE